MGSHISHTSEEEKYVLPPPCHRMDYDHPGAHAPLEKPQATVLALWSLGMVLARSCALTASCVFGDVAAAQRADCAPAVA